MHLPVTTLYALPLVAVWLVLWCGVALQRATQKVSIGDGEGPLLVRVRRHGNFIEWVPFALVLMMLAELQGVDACWMHVSGAALLLGRVLHPFGLVARSGVQPLRFVGNGLNMLTIVVLFVALVSLRFGV